MRERKNNKHPVRKRLEIIKDYAFFDHASVHSVKHVRWEQPLLSLVLLNEGPRTMRFGVS